MLKSLLVPFLGRGQSGGGGSDPLATLKSSITTALSAHTHQYWFADDSLSMFQDDTATTPATSAGDPVRAIKMLGSGGDYTYAAIDANDGALEATGSRLAYRAGSARLRANPSGWGGSDIATVWFIYEADDQSAVTTQADGNYLMHFQGGLAGWVLGAEGGNSRYFHYAGLSGYRSGTLSGRTIATSIRNSNTLVMYENGASLGSVGIGTRTHTGDADILPMLGRQVGCVIAAAAVDTTERENVESALASYYGITLP